MQNKLPIERLLKMSRSLRSVIHGSFVGSALVIVNSVFTVAAATVIDDTVKKTTVTGQKGFSIGTATVFEGDLRQLPAKAKWQPGDPIKVANPRHVNDIQKILPAVNPVKAGDPLVARQQQAKFLPKVAGRSADLGVNVEGVGFNGVNPPDPTGEVGLNYYVQSTNASGGSVINIYNKNSGELVVENLSMASLQSGDCTDTWGDPIVMFDEHANRWLWTEFSSNSHNKLCVLVSKSDDPINGGWYAYEFQAPSFPDYPKFSQMGGVYYASANEGTSAVYAFERAKMLNGEAAAMVRQEIPRLAGFGFNSITPVDVDGQTKAPEGSPGMFIRHRDDELHNSGSNNAEKDYLELWTLEPDFTTPANSRLSGPINIEVSEFNSYFTCPGPGFGCLTQKDSSFTLDPLREVVMYKSQYRNFGAHESIVGNFITNPGDDVATLRWFELRRVGSSDWSVYDEGSYTKNDGISRYMAGSAIDSSGNHIIAYMMTGADKYPSLAYNGRLASDASGMLTFGEKMIIEGASSIESDRDGDYSHMAMDPVDDCTMWFTSEYGKQSGQWGTRVSSFKVSTCGDPNPGFTLSGTNLTQSICRSGDFTAMTISASPYNNFDGSINLAFADFPNGFSGSLDPSSITTSETSAATVTVAQDTSAGSYSLDIIATSDGATQKSLTANLKVITDVAAVALSEPVNEATGVSTSVTFSWSGSGDVDSYTIEVATDAEFSNIVAQSVVSGGTSYRPSAALQSDTTYYWRVTANNICGNNTSSVSSFSTVDATDGATELPFNYPFGPFSAETGVLYAFYIDVPAGANDLEFILAADNGDADLYISKDTISTTRGDFICISETFSSNESCTISGEVSGLYFALVYAYGAYNDATLFARYSGIADITPVVTGFNAVATDEDTAVTVSLEHLVIENVDDGALLTLNVFEGENYSVTGPTVTPDVNFNGELLVNVSVSSGFAQSEVVRLPIVVNAVNDAPLLAADVTADIDEDSRYVLTTESLNIIDVDSTHFTIMVSEGENYSVSGSIIIPDANFNGSLSAMIKVNDGELDSNEVGLVLTVNGINDAPVLPNDVSASMSQATSYILTVANTGATDIDGDELSFNITSGDNYVVDGNTITPDVEFFGQLAITFSATDGETDSNEALLNLTVIRSNESPVAIDDVAGTTVGGTTRIDVLANDSDPDDDEIAISAVQYSGAGSVEIADGYIFYTAGASFTGSETFSYTIEDVMGATASAEVLVNVVEPQSSTVSDSQRTDSGGSIGLASLLLLPLLVLRRRQYMV